MLFSRHLDVTMHRSAFFWSLENGIFIHRGSDEIVRSLFVARTMPSARSLLSFFRARENEVISVAVQLSSHGHFDQSKWFLRETSLGPCYRTFFSSHRIWVKGFSTSLLCHLVARKFRQINLSLEMQKLLRGIS